VASIAVVSSSVPIVVPIAVAIDVPISGINTLPIDSNLEPWHSQPSVIISEKKYHERISLLLQFFCINYHEL
jgi:hypothetical protein